jgi:TIR domain
VLQAWDFRPGDNFVAGMRDALQQADRTIAVLSPAYLDSPYGTDEWTAAFLHDPDGRQRPEQEPGFPGDPSRRTVVGQ